MQRNMKDGSYTEKKGISRNCEGTETLDLLDKDFKSAIIIIFKELKETV